VPAELSSPIPPGLASLCDASPLAEAEPPHLLTYLAAVPDPRAARGRRHPLVAILAMAAAAVLTGARSFAAIAEWAADTPQPIRAALDARHDPLAGGFLVPPRPPSAAPSAGWTPTPWPPQWATGWSHATATTTPPPRSGHGSGRWPSTARRCAAPTHPTATAAPSTCWRRWSTPAASCWQPAGCLLSQPVTRPAQALGTAALWRRDSPPAFRARRG
jgi:DDE_Tnp_1-associated